MAQGAATIADVQSSSWSLALDKTVGRGAGSGIGNIVQSLSDIDQCIGIILTTIPGQDPLRPTFGCNLPQYIDKPLPIAQSKLVGAVTNALSLWEPRIKVARIVVQIPMSQQIGSLVVTVEWTLNIGALGPNPQLIGADFNLFRTQSTTVILL